MFFTFFPVVALHVNAEDGDLLLPGLVVVDVDEGDRDAPGGQVPQGARDAGWFCRGVVLHHYSGLLHLQGGKTTWNFNIQISVIIIQNKP